MALIRCESCSGVHDSHCLVCPCCGLCPSCGRKRVPRADLVEACPKCGVPYCEGCGRCHTCAAFRFADLPPCECGHPSEERFAVLEKHFGLEPRSKPNVVVLLAILVISGLFVIGAVVVHILRNG